MLIQRGKARTELESLIADLEAAKMRAPERARQFREHCDELAIQIRDKIPTWKPLIADDVVTQFRERVRRFVEIGEPLAELIRKAAQREQDVRRLAERLPKGSEDRPWLEERSREWLLVLGRLGSKCHRTEELYRDQGTLHTLEADLDRTGQALDLLREAAQIVSVLGIRAAELTARLPDFRKRLHAPGAVTENWLSEIRSVIQPFRTPATQVAERPPEIRPLNRLMADIRNWSMRLGEMQADVQGLQDRLGDATNGSPAQLKAFTAEAEALRTRLVNRAQERRTEMFGRFEEDMIDLRRASDHLEDLEQKLSALRDAPSSEANVFQEWLHKAKQFESSFADIAMSNYELLKSSLTGRIERITQKLEALRKRPLSQEVQDEVELLGLSIQRFSRADGVEKILDGLRATREDEQKATALVDQADRDFHEIEERQKELTARSEELEKAAARVKKRIGIETAEIISRIAALSVPAATSLAQRRILVETLAVELKDLETPFVERCREQLSHRHGEIRRATEVVKTISRVQPLVDVPSIADDASPAEAAQAVIDAAQSYRVLWQAGLRQRQQLRVRRDEARSGLAALRRDELTAIDRQTIDHLLLDLAAEPATKGSLFDRLEELNKPVVDSDDLFDRLLGEERRITASVKDLRLKLRQQLYDEQLNLFCPELANRVSALVNGIPPKPRHWKAIDIQLKAAIDLFERVKLHASRLAAEQLVVAEEVLRRRVHAPDDPAFQHEQALLAELAACSPEKLPPLNLRQRVVAAASQGRG